jgi:hypothetical protein
MKYRNLSVKHERVNDMEEDIRNVIQRKIWTAEQFLSQSRELTTRAKKLPEEAQKSIPVFSGEWSENSVKKYLETFGIAIRNPLRYKNRKLLENIGIQTKGISEEFFDESTAIEDIVGLFEEIKKLSGVVTTVLIEREILLQWLREGIDKAKEKMKEISNAKKAFQRVLESGTSENLRGELLHRSIENVGFISSAEDIISKVNFIDQFGISTEYGWKFDELHTTLGNIHNTLTNLQTEYGIQKEEISELKTKALK